MNKIIKFIINIGIPLLIGTLVGILINPYINYNDLTKPPLSPPSITFPIGWTIIYFLMGLSFFLLKNPSNKDKTIYYVQLIVNALWSIFFFIFKWYLFSSLWIILLIIIVIIMIKRFWKNNKISSLINIPYLIWLLFATYLSFGIYFLN